MARFMRRRIKRQLNTEDPLLGVANLFDLALVMVVGFIISFLSAYHILDMFKPDTQITIFKKTKKKVEIVIKKGKTIKVYKSTGKSLEGVEGEKIGTAYRLKDGRIVYVPE